MKSNRNKQEDNMIERMTPKGGVESKDLYQNVLSEAKLKLCYGNDMKNPSKFCEYFFECRKLLFAALPQCCFEEGIQLPSN